MSEKLKCFGHDNESFLNSVYCNTNCDRERQKECHKETIKNTKKYNAFVLGD